MTTLEKKLNINSKHCLTIIEHLKASGGNARIVGGAVRDALLGIGNADIDITTDLLPEQVSEILGEHKIKTIPTGIKFGTVTALIQGESFEITTLRRDIDCDGRHAEIEYSKDFAEDAARRDFTINALSYCPIEHIIYDYFNGLKDLKLQKLVFIGTPEQRIREDYLRILRFFRFSCRYAKNIDQDGLAACITNKHKLKQLSGERIKAEMDSLLAIPNTPPIINIMFESGILQEILPVEKYEQALHIKLIDITKKFSSDLSLETLYSMLFRNTDKLSQNSLLQLKFSRNSAKSVIKMLGLSAIKDSALMATELKKVWLEEQSYAQYFIYAALIESDSVFIEKLYAKLGQMQKPTFPLKGGDLQRLGYEGQELGEFLNSLKTQWIESDFTLTKEQLINSINDKT